MEYTSEELLEIYNKSRRKKPINNELKKYEEKLQLICARISFDEYAMQDIINMLILFDKLNILVKINEESLDLLCTIILGNKEGKFDSLTVLYFSMYLKNILLSSCYNGIERESDIPLFLGEFDNFNNAVCTNLEERDWQILKKYNQDLYEVLKTFKECSELLEETPLFQYGSLTDKLILTITFNHLATLFYLKIDDYEKDYTILIRVYQKILENYLDFINYCLTLNIYEDLLVQEGNSNIVNEFIFCERLLNQEYESQVKVKRRKED